MRIFQYISIIILVFLIGFYINQKQQKYQILSGNVFGTTYMIKIRTNNNDMSLPTKIKKELDIINSQMSVFNPDSEISKINESAANTKIYLSENMQYLLKHSKKVYSQSEGAFDTTVAPLVENWGFGVDKNVKEPSSEQIKNTLKQVGFDKLEFDNDFKIINKLNNKISLNLSAIAKGYGVDKIAKLLEKDGYTNYIIEIGGEIRAKGYRDNNKEPWILGVKEPKEDGENVLALDVTNISVATSGDYQNYHIDKNGKRYSHTISPKTGYPVHNSLASVTVFTKKCIDADAYATAMMAMGYQKAKVFAEKYGIDAIFFIHTKENGFAKDYSASAKKLLEQ